MGRAAEDLVLFGQSLGSPETGASVGPESAGVSGRCAQPPEQPCLVSGCVGFSGRRAGGVRLGGWDGVGSSPDGEIFEEVVVDVRGQAPLPERPGGCACLACLTGNVLGELLDAVCEPVEVGVGVWVLL